MRLENISKLFFNLDDFKSEIKKPKTPKDRLKLDIKDYKSNPFGKYTLFKK
jgi:hypothetical protein